MVLNFRSLPGLAPASATGPNPGPNPAPVSAPNPALLLLTDPVYPGLETF